eukprot:XP_001700130.1 predicted protein [Chlamydomonas reinhardtii]
MDLLLPTMAFVPRTLIKFPWEQKKDHPPTPISDHARYRWLLNVDGMSASTRMGFLMTTDSAILKSRSPFIEYYSRLQSYGRRHAV